MKRRSPNGRDMNIWDSSDSLASVRSGALAPAASFPGSGESRLARFAYSVLEVSIAAIVLIVTSPILLGLALYIRATSKGPALFRQERLGQGAVPFRFVKFRTMHVDARERFPELYEYDYTDEEIEKLKFKLFEDPRVTPQGAWLRTTSLDELPNFWNVLTRRMALVGPRPEIPEMLRYYRGPMGEKFAVRPGITGYAQTRGRGRLSFMETANHDLEYVIDRTPWVDLKVLVHTLWLILRRDGAF